MRNILFAFFSRVPRLLKCIFLARKQTLKNGRKLSSHFFYPYLTGDGQIYHPLTFSECCSQTVKAIELKLANFFHLLFVQVSR